MNNFAKRFPNLCCNFTFFIYRKTTVSGHSILTP
uniref:Uncharacterized protein n=1 Tax=Microviridae sp. ctNWS1 TaxID=2826733 RepID=A0A8S5N3S6_9VIRU|nr:MAG TPA: hypothetical protein [Microviridae sp. ctNWS1]